MKHINSTDFQDVTRFATSEEYFSLGFLLFLSKKVMHKPNQTREIRVFKRVTFLHESFFCHQMFKTINNVDGDW